jgi:hypothetical protein
MKRIFTLLTQFIHTFPYRDAGVKPCNSGGVSPSMLRALSCFTGPLLTGQNRLPSELYTLKPWALIARMVVVLLRVERPRPVLMNEDRPHHTFPLFATPALEYAHD